jgi:hypothetical protein
MASAQDTVNPFLVIPLLDNIPLLPAAGGGISTWVVVVDAVALIITEMVLVGMETGFAGSVGSMSVGSMSVGSMSVGSMSVGSMSGETGVRASVAIVSEEVTGAGRVEAIAFVEEKSSIGIGRVEAIAFVEEKPSMVRLFVTTAACLMLSTPLFFWLQPVAIENKLMPPIPISRRRIFFLFVGFHSSLSEASYFS